MARQALRLTAIGVKNLTRKGMYPDGNGLYLQVTESGRSWIFRYALHGRSREMGLGPLHTVSLGEARQRAAHCRKLKLDGIDPIEDRDRQLMEARLATANTVSFKEAAELYIKGRSASWKSATHSGQWPSTLAKYVYPIIGGVAVQSVDVGMVVKVLEPIWYTKTETASRIRGRIQAVLDWASARGYRQGDNPARWRGHLENLLPKRSKVQSTRNFPALPYREISKFMAVLRRQNGIAASALEFVILTATRTSETIGATWKEVDMETGIWTIPAARIKAGREHRIPLSEAALAVLKRMGEPSPDSYVFPGGKKERPLSNMALTAVLRRMDRNDITVHGFRSTFRDWAAECTNFPREVAEMALVHAIGDRVEAAYRRGDLFEKRRLLMEEWAVACNGGPERGASSGPVPGISQEAQSSSAANE